MIFPKIHLYYKILKTITTETWFQQRSIWSLKKKMQVSPKKSMT